MSSLLPAACLVVVLLLVELVVLHRRVHALPLATWSVMKKERDADQAAAMAALEDAAAKKAAALLAGIRRYHDELGSDLRAQAINAETRAKVLERRSMEAGLALDAASHLLAQLRELLDELSARRAAQPAQVAAGLGPRPHAPPQKRTLLGIRPPPMPDEGDRVTEDELTRVVDRPELPSKKGGAS